MSTTLNEVLEQVETETRSRELTWSPMYDDEGTLMSTVELPGEGITVTHVHKSGKLEVIYGRGETDSFGITADLAEAIIRNTHIEFAG